MGMYETLNSRMGLRGLFCPILRFGEIDSLKDDSAQRIAARHACGSGDAEGAARSQAIRLGVGGAMSLEEPR